MSVQIKVALAAATHSASVGACAGSVKENTSVSLDAPLVNVAVKSKVWSPWVQVGLVITPASLRYVVFEDAHVIDTGSPHDVESVLGSGVVRSTVTLFCAAFAPSMSVQINVAFAAATHSASVGASAGNVKENTSVSFAAFLVKVAVKSKVWSPWTNVGRVITPV